MSQSKQRVSVRGQTSTCFTISQTCLGAQLRFEPALGSKELDQLVDAFVPGNGTLQQKRARVSLDFFNTIELSHLVHPVSRRYHVPHFRTFTTSSEHSSPEASASPAASKSLKRAREDSTKDVSSKRLPGFSILTRDGVDITEYASRGPKTKEQRDHAALMRRLGTCGPCKRSKQRCDPSHHRLAASPTTSTTPSSAAPSLTPTFSWSQPSISPQSAIEDSFNQSPNQKASTIAHAGGEFSSLFFESPNSTYSPADMAFMDPLEMSAFDSIPLQDVDPQFFDLADLDLNVSSNMQQPFNPADWAMWGIQSALTQDPSRHSTVSLEQASPFSLETWDVQRASQTSMVSRPLSQFTQDPRDAFTAAESQSWQYASPETTELNYGLQQQAASLDSPALSRTDSTSYCLPQVLMDDFVLYPESPLDGQTERSVHSSPVIGTMQLQTSENSPEPEPLIFNFDGSFIRSSSGARKATKTSRPSSKQNANLPQALDSSGQEDVQHESCAKCSPAISSLGVIEGNLFKHHQTKNQDIERSCLRRQVKVPGSSVLAVNAAPGGFVLGSNLPVVWRNNHFRPFQLASSEPMPIISGDTPRPRWITALEVAHQITSNDRWLAQRLTARMESRRHTSLGTQAQSPSDSVATSFPCPYSQSDDLSGNCIMAPSRSLSRYFNTRHYQTMYGQSTAQATRPGYSRSSTKHSAQHSSLSQHNHGYWNYSLQEAHSTTFTKNTIQPPSNFSVQQRDLQQSILGGSVAPSIITNVDMQTLPTKRDISISPVLHKTIVNSDIDLTSYPELTDIPAPHLLENAITRSSQIIEQAVDVMRLTVLLSMSLMAHCRGGVLAQFAMYTAMALFSIGTMNFYSQWTFVTILIFAKALHSWPDVMADTYSALENVIGFGKPPTEESISQGIQEGNDICSTSFNLSIHSLQSEEHCDSVRPSSLLDFFSRSYYSPTTIESFSTLASVLSRYSRRSNIARKISRLDC